MLVVSKAENGQKKAKKPSFNRDYIPIQRQSTLPDQVDIDGVSELKHYLVTHRKHDFAQSLVERLLAYALSRDLDYHDEDLIKQLVERFEADNYSVPILIREIVQSERFHRGY